MEAEIGHSAAKQWRDEMVTFLPRLQRFAFSLTGSVEDAEDLLHATVEKALLKYDQFEQGTHLDRWMFRICKNLWMDEWRSRRVRGIKVDYEDDKYEPWIDGERSTIDKIRLREVNRAMDELQDEQRVVLTLVAVEGHSYKDVAELLEIPIGTVMSRLARARRKLAQQLPLEASLPQM